MAALEIWMAINGVWVLHTTGTGGGTNPPVDGFPTALSAGADGTTKTAYTGMSIDTSDPNNHKYNFNMNTVTDHTTFTNMHFAATVEINNSGAGGLTWMRFVNCTFASGLSSGNADLFLEDCTFGNSVYNGGSPTHTFLMDNCKVIATAPNCGDGIGLQRGSFAPGTSTPSTITNNYVEITGSPTDQQHLDPIHVWGAGDVEIRNNSFVFNFPDLVAGLNSAANLDKDNGGCFNIDFNGNRLVGGGYVLSCSATDSQIRNNKLEKFTSSFGELYPASGNRTVWVNNKNGDGTLLPPPAWPLENWEWDFNGHHVGAPLPSLWLQPGNAETFVDGSLSLKATVEVVGNGIAEVCTAFIPANANQSYSYSIPMRVKDVARNQSVTITAHDATGAHITNVATTSPTSTAANTWKNQVCSGTTPVGTVYIRLHMFTHGVVTNDVFYMDRPTIT